MSPYGFARAECANMRPVGICLWTEKPCLLKQGKRCSYFERCILPLADDSSPHAQPDLQSKRLAARETYLGQHALVAGKDESNNRTCPECGSILGKYQRLCDKCRVKRRREADRRKKQRKRGEPVPQKLNF